MLERRLIALVRGSGFELCLLHQERSLPDRYVSIYTMLADDRPARSASGLAVTTLVSGWMKAPNTIRLAAFTQNVLTHF